MSKRILHVVTNVGHYDDDPSHPTGLWLSELCHAWHVFEEAGYQQTLVSPRGGHVPLEPRALKFPNYDKTAKAWRADPARMEFLESTLSPADIDSTEFDAIYFTGGHAVMYDFLDSEGLQRIAGKRMTGFAWREEKLAKVDELVPYNAEELAKERGARYEKARLPFVPYAVVDGNLVSGQNPASAKRTAKEVVALLEA